MTTLFLVSLIGIKAIFSTPHCEDAFYTTDNNGNFYYKQNNTLYDVTFQIRSTPESIKVTESVSLIVPKNDTAFSPTFYSYAPQENSPSMQSLCSTKSKRSTVSKASKKSTTSSLSSTSTSGIPCEFLFNNWIRLDGKLGTMPPINFISPAIEDIKLYGIKKHSKMGRPPKKKTGSKN